MSETAAQGQILSREELDALLHELAQSQQEADEQKRVFSRSASPTAQSMPFAPLRKGVDRFAAEYAKALSSVYQRRVVWEIVGWDEIPFADVAEELLPLDRLVSFAVEPSEDLGYLVVSRPLAFQWLCLSYGGRTGTHANPVPERPYTRIEKRFLERIVAETLGQLNAALAELAPVRTRLIGIEEPRVLLENAEDALLVVFEVRGFGETAYVRLALPTGPLKRFETPRRRLEPRQRPGVRNAVLDVRVPLRVEVGSAEVALRDLASLQPGTLIPLSGPDDGSLIVRVGGAAKFKAMHGVVQGRLAVQVTERIG